MADPESRPSEKKIAALLLIAIVTAAIGLYSYSREAPEVNGFLGSIASKISLTGFSLSSDDSEKSLEIESILTFDVAPEIALRMQNAANGITILTSGKNTISIDRNMWEILDGTALDMKNFTGKVTLGPLVSLSGDAYSIRLNLASQSISEKGIPIQASVVSTKSVIFTGVNSISIDLKNITGTIKASDGKNSATYEVKNNILSISGFSGDIEFYGNKIVLRGKGMMNADLLKKRR